MKQFILTVVKASFWHISGCWECQCFQKILDSPTSEAIYLFNTKLKSYKRLDLLPRIRMLKCESAVNFSASLRFWPHASWMQTKDYRDSDKRLVIPQSNCTIHGTVLSVLCIVWCTIWWKLGLSKKYLLVYIWRCLHISL